MSKKDNAAAETARAAFPSAMDAKTFLAERIAAQAGREGVALDELERKSLYFSETYEAPPDALDVAREFDHEHDATEYEEKIAGLARRAYDADAGDPEVHQRWRDAIARIEHEDHYILVMLGQAGLLRSGKTTTYRVTLALIAGAVVFLFVAKFIATGGSTSGWTAILPKAIAVFIVGAIVWSMLPRRKRG